MAPRNISTSPQDRNAERQALVAVQPSRRKAVFVITALRLSPDGQSLAVGGGEVEKAVEISLPQQVQALQGQIKFQEQTTGNLQTRFNRLEQGLQTIQAAASQTTGNLLAAHKE